MKTNLGFESEICPENAYYREARDGVFDIFGLLCPRKLDHYRRVPEDVAAATSTSVAALSSNTAFFDRFGVYCDLCGDALDGRYEPFCENRLERVRYLC